MASPFLIRRIESPREVKNLELRQMVEKAAILISEEFIAVASDGSEAGFISIENIPHDSLTFIYLIFVLSQYRSLGLGNSLLTRAEDEARAKGHRSIRLKPMPADEGIERDHLINWYIRHGYRWSSDSDQMEKVF